MPSALRREGGNALNTLRYELVRCLSSMAFVAAVPSTSTVVIATPVVAFSVVAPPRLAAAAVIAPLPSPLPVPAPWAWVWREEVGHGDTDVDPDLALGGRYIHDLDDANQRYPNCQQRRYQ
jgi:hypothetical protein